MKPLSNPWLLRTLPVLVGFLPFIWLCVFNHPSADDFPITDTSRVWGSYTAVVGYYKCWSSRYTSIFLMSVNPLVFGSLWGYKLCTLLLMGLLTGSLYFFLKTFFLFKNPWAIAGLSLLSVLVYMGACPSLAEGFYYLGGALFYQPGNALLLILTASLVRYSPPERLFPLTFRRLLPLAIQCGTVVLLVGCNELTMVLVLALTGAIWLYRVWNLRKPDAGLSLLLTTAILAAVVVLVSPATFYRMEASGSFNRTLSEVLEKAIPAAGKSVQTWFTNPSFVLLVVLFLVLKPDPKVPVLSGTVRAAITAGSVALFLFCYVPPFLGEGLLQLRTENAIQFVFLFLTMLNVAIWKAADNPIRANDPTKPPFFSLEMVFPAVLASVLFSPNFILACQDLYSGKAKAYSIQRDDRIFRMENTPGDTVWIPAVTHKPLSIFYGDIGDFPDPWYDNHFAALYGKKFVHLGDSLSRARLKKKKPVKPRIRIRKSIPRLKRFKSEASPTSLLYP